MLHILANQEKVATNQCELPGQRQLTLSSAFSATGTALVSFCLSLTIAVWSTSMLNSNFSSWQYCGASLMPISGRSTLNPTQLLLRRRVSLCQLSRLYWSKDLWWIFLVYGDSGSPVVDAPGLIFGVESAVLLEKSVMLKSSLGSNSISWSSS